MKPDLSCKDFLDLLADYLGGELPAGEHERCRLHLDSCADCTAYMRSYESTLMLLRDDEPSSDAPESMVQQILAARRRPS